MTPGIVEYVALRLARRFLVTDALLRRFGGLVPYYRTNTNEVDPAPVVRTYRECLERCGRQPVEDPVILEIGSGATNSVGYAMVAEGMAGVAGRVVLFEPFAPLDVEADRRRRAALAPGVADRVRRIATLGEIPAGSVDLVVSYSVLEHVRDPQPTLAELARVMSPAAFMVHFVDYRDHFFKYPFHFLLFSKRTWERWLDPGDLPRWRLGDHLRAFAAAGFRARVLEAETLPLEFARVAPRIDPQFDRADPNTAVVTATLFVERMG